MRGERIQMALKAGRHQPASETPWPKLECWLGSFVIFRGSGQVFAKKPYIFVIFRWWTPAPSLDPRTKHESYR